jgi:hypothetical protein
MREIIDEKQRLFDEYAQSGTWVATDRLLYSSSRTTDDFSVERSEVRQALVRVPVVGRVLR